MNKVYVVKRNALGQAVVTSELAKNKGKVASMASILLSSLIATSAIATPVSIQGTATSENAVSIGSDSFATAVDGVATGKSSVATGQGFSRDDFAVKVKEVKDLTAAKNAAQSDLNNLNNNKKTNEATQSSLNDQIADATQKIADAANKIAEKDALTEQKNAAEGNQSALDQNVTDAQNALAAILKEGKNLYLAFTPVLAQLDYNKLNETNGRTILATELKTLIETDFPDFAGKYETEKYAALIDGYVNKQAGYEGSVIGISKQINENILASNIMQSLQLDRLKGIPQEALSDISYHNLTDSINSQAFGAFGFLGYDRYSDGIPYEELNSKHSYVEVHNLSFVSQFSKKLFNSILLASTSSKNLINDGIGDYIGLVLPKTHEIFDNSWLTFKLKTITNSFVDPLFMDSNTYYIEILKRIASSNSKTLTIPEIDKYSSYYNKLKNFYNDVDWNDANAAYDLTSYKSKLDKVISVADKINEYNNLYREITALRTSANADQSVIDNKTSLLLNLYKELINLNDDPENKLKNYTFSLTDKATEYLNYSKEKSDVILDRISKELNLYDKDDAIVVDVTNQAQKLQQALDDAKTAAEENQAIIDDLENQINDLGLTPSEESAAETKADLEKQLEDAKNKQEEINNNIADKTKELEDLEKQLENSSLKDLGLRSQAHGSNAFASGNDSIAIGTDTTVTSTDGIAIGRGSEVTGDQSIALGAENTVTGDKSIAIGVGHTVSGNRSTTIGDPNTITGNDVFVAGNNNNVASNNVMVMGNNITVGTGFDGAVVLGANSTVAAANPTSSIEIQGNTYNFAGTNPTSTVSVGKAGEERQITNVAAGRISETSTDAINGSQLYAVTEALNAIQTINLDDIADNINNAKTTVTAGQGISITENDNVNGSKNYTASAKLGEGLSFDENGAIRANGTTLHAGENVEITGDTNGGYTINARTQIINGGKATVVHAGDNVRVTGDIDNGFTVNVDNMRTTVTGGQGAEVTSSDNADGSKNYTVNVKVGDGLTYDDKGNVVNDMKLTAGDNVQVSGDAKGGYTISATDTNTQATVSADKGITITETNNANGTKNYAVSAKLGKGLKVDENGAIAATAQPINGGAGVSITTNAQDEAIVNVTGVTTTTDDGKSYTRSDLTKSVGVKGDGKNIRTSTTANGDVQVKLADDIQVNSVSINNGPTINQQGINAANTRITNVKDGVAPTDAVNVRQLKQQGNILNQRIDNLADNMKKNKKRNDAGIASTAAMANIPQVMLAGKSGVGVGVGHRSGQSAIAVGYSRASDNAKHIIKLSAGLDTQSKATFGAGYMYQW